jgi:hypothetical protein
MTFIVKNGEKILFSSNDEETAIEYATRPTTPNTATFEVVE